MEKQWTAVIRPKNNLLDLKLKEVWKYRDLIKLFVARDFKTRYKQTLLGPLWFIIQPLLTTVIFNFVFKGIAGLSTEGVPAFLFYLAGNVPWLYFASCITNTSNTFVNNSAVFGKVYFPRLTAPISTVITALINFFIQFVMFLLFWLYYYFLRGASIHINWAAALTPVLILQLAILGMGFGIIISSLTTKYRDLQVLVGFGVSLWMFATPVIYASSALNDSTYRMLMLNPVSPIIEILRYGWLGAGRISLAYWGISWISTVLVLFIGIIIFNRVEKTFMDTV
ncbi:MAG: ABC transporter permease [Clostridia bacterium]|nr:ABC transporter permease [Clostridia bacterium]